MKKLLEYLPFHFTLSLIIGITSQFNFRIWSYGFSALAYVGFLLFVILILLRRSKIFFLGVWLFFFLVGVASVYLQDHRNYNVFYGYHVKKDASAFVEIKKILKSSAYYDKYEATVIKLDSVEVRGRVLLNIKRDTIGTSLNVGDLVLLKAEIVAPSPPLNPHQFDYRSYLEKLGIYHQMFVKNSEYMVLQHSQFSIHSIAADIRNSVQSSLKKHMDNEEVLSVIQALLLGQRQDISDDLKENYSKAGAIHILAVSGLHVGMLFLMLSYVFSPFERIRNGKLYKTLAVVLALWMFAFIAGLSASVVRAVTMFTFITLGTISNRRGSVLYALVSSAFFLLLIKPLFLFDVGFQLSYLAVLGIVWMQPKLEVLWRPRYFLIKKLWQLSTVSIAAQFMILPLSLYYFHQFPGLFMISNLVIVPFLGIILIGGILLILLSLIGMLPSFFVAIYEVIINALNNFVRWVATQEQFLITDISFSLKLLITSYIVVFSVGNLCSKWNPKKLMVLLGSIALLQGVLIYEKFEKNTRRSLIVFHQNRETMIGLRSKDSLHVYCECPASLLKSSALNSYAIGENVSIDYPGRLPNYFGLTKEEVLIVDKNKIYKFNGYSTPIILLRESSKINLERLIDHLSPKLIIADGSNYKSVVSLWKKTCAKKKTPFWYTGQNGAYIVEE